MLLKEWDDQSFLLIVWPVLDRTAASRIVSDSHTRKIGMCLSQNRRMHPGVPAFGRIFLRQRFHLRTVHLLRSITGGWGSTHSARRRAVRTISSLMCSVWRLVSEDSSMARGLSC